MIIACKNCNKKFAIDVSIIPEKGRLLQCNSCNYKWFYKKEVIKDIIVQGIASKPEEETEAIPVEKPRNIEDSDKSDSQENITFFDKKIENHIVKKKDSRKDKKVVKKFIKLKSPIYKNINSFNILGSTIVFLISFIGLVIIVDTFKVSISKIVPNIEILLYNLYESINDIVLFFKDLI